MGTWWGKATNAAFLALSNLSVSSPDNRIAIARAGALTNWSRWRAQDSHNKLDEQQMHSRHGLLPTTARMNTSRSGPVVSEEGADRLCLS
eukprot:3763779-Pyramimonas_sp.AAC.1